METEARQLTGAEKKAVDSVEKALAAVPKSITLFFNESGFHVFDSEVWCKGPEPSAMWHEEQSSDHRHIACRYDTGAL